ncbi:hypothetical protein GCM10011502_21290 [Oceanisphaera marina]|uniref:histidine kinase n=1 Tax=Oceanisphaera marina TaxID=2017550 RepID=A0ABQ1IN25_9GAMM|nr:ATP-binding protein [Oceanisphaera marina]GGB47695.1 hypothetical protein GCM10011502_21290 [Oceanisphaera marina]
MLRFVRPRLVSLILVALIIGLLVYWQGYSAARVRNLIHLSDLAASATSTLNLGLGHVRNSLRLLYAVPDVRHWLGINEQADPAALTETLASMGRVDSNISQIRWLDADGYERVRVNISEGQSQVVPKEHLQLKRQRYYFTHTMQYPCGEVYLSPVDLNVENNTIVRPFQATLRASIRTCEQEGLLPGMLLLNVNLNDILDRVRAMTGQQINLSVMDQQGYWLVNTDPDKEWGFMRDQPSLTLAKQSPELWQHIVSEQNIKQLFSSFGQVVMPVTLSSATSTTHNVAANRLYVAASLTPAYQQKIHNELLLRAVGVSLLLLGTGVWLIRREWHSLQQERHLSSLIDQERQQLANSNQRLSAVLQQQQQLRDELVEKQKLSSLGMMVAGVAHEINTPAGGALMAISHLQQQRQQLQQAFDTQMTRSELQGFLTQSQEGLDLAEHNLSRIRQQVRSFKRLAVDRHSEEPVLFELTDVVTDLLNVMHSNLKQARVTVHSALDQPMTLFSLPGVISQVLQSLMENALAHAFRDLPRGQVQIDAQLHDEKWCSLSVTDNGHGIVPELIETLFEPFVTSGRQFGHSGLGLNLVRQWVYGVLDGKIEVHSEPGKGTRFTLMLPRILIPSSSADNEVAAKGQGKDRWA